jgi:predicted nucleic acid-binding Zn ribbon protein
MAATVITRIMTEFPAAGIESVKFLGPDTPSWKRGPRTIPGRGPRDTYG